MLTSTADFEPVAFGRIRKWPSSISLLIAESDCPERLTSSLMVTYGVSMVICILLTSRPNIGELSSYIGPNRGTYIGTCQEG